MLFLPLLLLWVFDGAFGASLPANFVKCSVTDAKCLNGGIEKVLHELPDGLSSIGLASLDPVRVPALSIGAGTGAVHLVQNYQDVKLRGISKSKVSNSNFDTAKNILKFTLKMEKLILDARYDINGKILVLPVYGNGSSLLTLHNATVDHEIHFKTVEKENKKFLQIVEYNLHLGAEKIVYLFENLFNGNKELSDNIHNVVNDNWDEIFQDVREGYEDAFGKIFNNIAKRIFNRFPANEIFNY